MRRTLAVVLALGIAAACAVATTEPPVPDRDLPIETRTAATKRVEGAYPVESTFWRDYIPGERPEDWWLRRIFANAPDQRPKDRSAFYSPDGGAMDAPLNTVMADILKRLSDVSPTYLTGAQAIVYDCAGATAYHLQSGNIAICQELLHVPNYEEELAFVLAHELGHRFHRHYALEQKVRDEKVEIMADSYSANTLSIYTNAFIGGGILAWFYATTRPETRTVSVRNELGRVVTVPVRQTRSEKIEDTLTTFSGVSTIVGAIAVSQFTFNQASNRWQDYRLWRASRDYLAMRDAQEREADAFAVELMARAGYNPDATQTFLHDLAASQSGRTPDRLESRAERGFGRAREAQHWGGQQRRDDRIAALVNLLQAQEYAEPAPLAWIQVDEESGNISIAASSEKAAPVTAVIEAIGTGIEVRRELGAIVKASRAGDAETRRAHCTAATERLAPLLTTYPNNAVFIRMRLALGAICPDAGPFDPKVDGFNFGEISELDTKLELLSFRRLKGEPLTALEEQLAKRPSTDLFDTMRIRVNAVEQSERPGRLSARCYRRYEDLDRAIYWRMPQVLRNAVDNWNLFENRLLNSKRTVEEVCDGARGVAREIADSERDRLRQARRRAQSFNLPPLAGDFLYVREAMDAARS